MDQNTTEGSIIQHLSKLRTRRIQAGKPVPPTLRRGNHGRRGTVTLPQRAHGGARGRGSRGGRMTRSATRNARAASDDESVEASEHYSSENSNEEGPRESGHHSDANYPRAQSVSSEDNGHDNAEDDDDEWVDEEYDADNNTEDRLLVPNADFLGYANDSEGASTTPSAAATATAESRVVTLSYGANRVAAVQAIIGQAPSIVSASGQQPGINEIVIRHQTTNDAFHENVGNNLGSINDQLLTQGIVDYDTGFNPNFDSISDHGTAGSSDQQPGIHATVFHHQPTQDSFHENFGNSLGSVNDQLLTQGIVGHDTGFNLNFVNSFMPSSNSYDTGFNLVNNFMPSHNPLDVVANNAAPFMDVPSIDNTMNQDMFFGNNEPVGQMGQDQMQMQQHFEDGTIDPSFLEDYTGFY